MKKIIRNPCQVCDGDTRHKIIYHYDIENEIDFGVDEKVFYRNVYMIVECCGCESVSFTHYEKNSNKPIKKIDLNDDEGDENDFVMIWHYPQDGEYSNSEIFLKYEELDMLPSKIYNLYEQVMNSFATFSDLLSGVGLRMLVEAVCLDQNIKGKNLVEKIENLYKEGLISNNERPILDKLRLIGNSSAHNITSIKSEYLEYAVGIVNHLLVSIYILPKINNKLNKIIK